MNPPPWAIYASDAGQGTGVLSTEAHNIGGGRTAEPQWPRLDRQLDLVGDRLKENSNHARRNLVWFDQNTTRLPSLNARAMEGATAPAPTKPFWSARLRPSDGGNQASSTQSAREISGYTGFRPREQSYQDNLRYKTPVQLSDRAKGRGVRRGVYGYRGFIPRSFTKDKDPVQIGFAGEAAHKQRFREVSRLHSPLPPQDPQRGGKSHSLEPSDAAGQRQRRALNASSQVLSVPVPPAHTEGYGGHVGRLNGGCDGSNTASISALVEPQYKAPLDFHRSMRRPHYVRHDMLDPEGARTGITM